MSFEKKRILRSLAPAFCVTLGLVACGDDVETEANDTTNVSEEDFSIETNYTQSGKRILVLKNGSWIYSIMRSFCDGPDLVDITRHDAPTRSDGHRACRDGRLTPEDFEIER